MHQRNSDALRPRALAHGSTVGPSDLSERYVKAVARGTQRLRMEYQATRQMLVRVIGEYATTKQDSLRDDSRTELPVYLRSSNGSYARALAFERNRARIDVLLSYLPTPATVFYVGYGDALAANRPAGPESLRRTRDLFILKLSCSGSSSDTWVRLPRVARPRARDGVATPTSSTPWQRHRPVYRTVTTDPTRVFANTHSRSASDKRMQPWVVAVPIDS